MLEQLQADCLKSQCRIATSKAMLLQEVKIGYLLDPATKQQSSKWYATSSPLPKKYQTAKLNSKVLLMAFFGSLPLGRPRPRWEDNIKMDPQEVGCGGYALDQAGSG